MKTIAEPARSVDVVLETDVLVVGSGPGGLAAALAAARAGARTALIDRNGCFGGNITQVGVEGFAWYRHEHTVDCEGIGIELETRATAMGAAMPEPQSLSHALDAMAASKAVAGWFGPVFLEAYLRHKRSEMQHVAEWAVNELCNRYAEVY